MEFENYPSITVGEDAFLATTCYTIISKFQKFAKNSKIHDASMEFENYPRITVGEDAFLSYYMLYHYFKISKIRQNLKIIRSSKKSTSHKHNADIILNACVKFESYLTKTLGGDRF